MKIYDNVLQTIGSTPLVKINSLNKGKATILAKVEFFNPAGSIKDRAAYYMIKKAQEEGKITPCKSTIIEPTSGNTGIGLALVCNLLGYKLILTMPETMSKERRDILKAYGAHLVLTEASKGMQGAIDEAKKLSEAIEDSFIPQQFENTACILAHYETTGKEIYDDLDGKVDIVIAGIGTAGTISGIGKYLKEKNKDIKIVGFEPSTSPLITQGIAGPHKIQGIGANFIPKNYLSEYVDEIYAIANEDAIETTKKLCLEEGIFAGITSGGAIYLANELSKKEENEAKTIVAILPDTGSRYLSAGVFN